jgi:hypothetical protein
MKTVRLDLASLDFDSALRRATAIAREQLGEDTMLLSWYDRLRDYESPAGVSECHEGCATKGFWDYAANRGARLALDFGDGQFVFCFL